MKLRYIQSKLLLVALGVGLGYLARMILGAPETQGPPQIEFHTATPDATQSALESPETNWSFEDPE